MKRRTLKKEIGDYVVYLVVRSLFCILACLSMSTAYKVASSVARFAYWVDRRHREVARTNLEHAFGDTMSPLDRERMVKDVYEHFCRVAVEMIFIPRKLHVGNWKKFFTIDVAPESIDILLQDRPRIFVTGHFGNWEMTGFLMAVIGMEPVSIARDLDNPYLHRFILRLRSWSGQRIVSKKGDYDLIQATLEKNGTLVSVADQSGGPKGYFVDFFGRKTSTHKALALLALEHSAPIVVGYAYRDRPGFHYRITNHRPIDPLDSSSDLQSALGLTAKYNSLLEEGIRRSPEQYFWLHNRWKHAPPPTRKRQAA